MIEKTSELSEEIRKLKERLDNVESALNVMKGLEVIDFRLIPKDEAVRLIRDYVKSRPGATTRQITEDLALDPLLVVETLQELESKGRMRSKDIER